MENDFIACFTTSSGTLLAAFGDPAPARGNGQGMAVLGLTLLTWALLRGVFRPATQKAVRAGDPTRIRHCRGCAAAHPGHARFCPQCGRHV